MRNGVRAIGVGLLTACAVLGFTAAYALASSEVAETLPAQATSEPPPPTTDPPPTDPAPPPGPPPSPRRPTIPVDVTVGPFHVGGLEPHEASAVLREEFSRPLVLYVGERRTSLAPRELGANAAIAKAVSRARFSRPGTRVPLHVGVSRTRIRTFVEGLGRDADRKPVNARLVLRGATVRAIPSVEGRRLQRLSSSRAIRIALKTHARAPVRLSFSPIRPRVSEDSLGSAVVILRESKRLRFYVDARLVRTFGVATGQAEFPTPVGSFAIVTKQRDPWWYPPPSDWAAGASPVPPGPGNPLGTRWMGISSPYVGIHGTPDAASIGYSASHGCIRMRISEAEWLFQRVELGTPVFIVRR